MRRGFTLFKALTILSLVSFEAKAQLPQFNLDWLFENQHTSSPSFSNEMNKVAVDTSTGVVYVLADMTSDLSPGGAITGQNYSYVGLYRVDPAGNLINSVLIDVGQHAVSGFDRKSGFGLQLDASGNVFIGYMNYGGVTDYDVNISKYSPTLNHLWTHKYNSPVKDEGLDLKVTTAGVAFAVVKSGGGPDPYRHRIIKANSQATTQSVFYPIPGSIDFPLSMALDGNLNLYLTGYTIQPTGGGHEILTMSVSGTGTSGSLRWRRNDNLGTANGDDIGKNITVGAGGGIYITGSSQGTVQHGVDVVTMRFAPNTGKKNWENIINFTLTDGGYFIIVPEPTTAYVGWKAGNSAYVDIISATNGTFKRRATYTPVPVAAHNSISGVDLADMKVSENGIAYIGGTVTSSSSGQTFYASWLAKVNFQGRGGSNIQMEAVVEGDFNFSRRTACIALDDRASLVLWGTDAAVDHMTHQYEVFQVSALSGTTPFRITSDGSETDQTYFEIFPNPASEHISIKANSAITRVRILGITGNEIVSFENSDSNTLIVQKDIRSLSQGTYLIEVKYQNGQIKHNRFIKQ